VGCQLTAAVASCRIGSTQVQWRSQAGARTADAAVAVILIAKESLAAEHRLGLRLAPDTELGPVNEVLSTRCCPRTW
jgi:hypothetical protein